MQISLDQPQRMVEWQQQNHRAETQPLLALRKRSEKNRRRRRAAERCAVMLCQMIGAEAVTVVSRGEPPPVGIEFAEQHTGSVEVVEHAEFHELFQASW